MDPDVVDETAWSSERREFSVAAREEALDAREAAVDERERIAEEHLKVNRSLEEDAGSRRDARAQRARQRDQDALQRLQRQEYVTQHLASGDFPLAARFAELAARLFTAKTVGDVLDQLVEHTAEIVSSVDAVSITVHADAGPHTPAASSSLARELDQVQYRHGEGPCLDAVATEGLAYATSADLTGRTTWPAFAADAAQAGCRSVLALGMFPHTTAALPRLASLNIYSTSTDAFDTHDREVAMLLAAHGAVALASATALDEAQLRADQLDQAMHSRDVIGQAKGILMERQKCTPEQAFDMLRDASNRLNTKLFDLAEQLAATGEPQPPRTRS